MRYEMTAGQDIFDRESIRRYALAIHRDDKDALCFTVWADGGAANGGPAWKQHGYKWPELLRHIRKISPESDKNRYLSLQSFCAPFRRAETLFRLNAIGYDIDIHREGAPPETADATLWRLERELFQTNVLPYPSITVHTGRGLQILYLLESLPKQGLPLWSLVGEAMARRIRDCLSDDTGVLDGNYCDAMRMLRAPGTYNTAAKRYARLLAPPPGTEPVYYRLDALRDEFLPELILPKRAGGGREEPRKAARKTGNISRLFNAYTLHMARLDDLIALMELRKAGEQPEDHRRRMVFLYRYWSCFCTGPETALEAAQDFNKGFHTPLPKRTVKQDTESAEKAYTAWKEDGKRGYNYRNDTLIKMLDITPEEQRHLKTIIGHAEKTRRRKERNWEHDKRDAGRAEKRTNKEKLIMDKIKCGWTWKKICDELKVSSKTVSKIKAKAENQI